MFLLDSGRGIIIPTSGGRGRKSWYCLNMLFLTSLISPYVYIAALATLYGPSHSGFRFLAILASLSTFG